MSSEYVVVGAGIIGLYTTFQLIHELSLDPSKITVLAEFLPGDQSINYTSPWAGGNFSCITSDDDDVLEYERYTYNNLGRIRKVLGLDAGLDKTNSVEYWDTHPGEKKINSLKAYLQDFTIIPKEELPEGVAFGINFTTWTFNCPFFLGNLKKYLESEGVKFQRKKLTHISQAYGSKTNVVFNCSGIGARTLGGVEDKSVYPTRGQVVVIRAPHIQINKMRWGDDYATYIIPRPHSGGEVVLGGFMQKDNWTADTFLDQTEDILKRTTELLPEILDQPISIIRVAAGLRPSRQGGVRIESIRGESGKLLIHNYGASGYGYQSGLSMGLKAVNLLKKENLRKLAHKL
jgi:D-amino-acid oxidase